MIRFRILLALALAGLASGLIWALLSIGEYRAEQDQYDQAIIHLNQTLLKQQARHEQTDRMLAETARLRADAVRRAGQLADDLRRLSGADACLSARIAPDVVERVQQYRSSPPVPVSGSAPSLD